jgi:hypothetical protein
LYIELITSGLTETKDRLAREDQRRCVSGYRAADEGRGMRGSSTFTLRSAEHV